MANEIVANAVPGLNLYARRFDASGQVWSGSAFVPLSFAASDKLPLIDSESSGRYMGSCSTAELSAGAASYEVRLRVGASPATSDPIIAADVIAKPAAFQFGGARAVAIRVLDDSNAVVANAKVRVAAGNNSELRATDTYGFARFSLDDGDYTLAIVKNGYTFTPATLTVDAAHTAFDRAIQTSVIPDPADPALCTVYGYALLASGAPAAGIRVTFKLTAVPGGTPNLYSKQPLVVVSDADGRISLAIPRGASFSYMGPLGRTVNAVAPDAANYELEGELL